jgi:hypothetical protein
VTRPSSYYANAFLVLVMSFLVLPTNSLLSSNPTFYAIRGINRIVATCLVLVTLALLWLCLIAVFYILNRAIRLKKLNMQVNNAILGVTFVYLFSNAVSLNIESVNVSPILKITIIVLGITLFILLRKRISENLIRTILFSLSMALVIQNGISSPKDLFPKWNSAANYMVDDTTPSILLIIADEASYWGMMNESGVARPGLTNLSELQKQATTYTDTYAVTANTDYAVPAILNGIADVVKSSELYKVNSKMQYGLFPSEKAGFKRYFQSEIFDDPCVAEGTTCNGNPINGRYFGFLADFWTIVAKNNLIGLRKYFPSVTERSKNYWSDVATISEEDDLVDFIGETSTFKEPKFMFFHSLSTHNPWNKNRKGELLWQEKYSEIGQFNSSDLLSLRKQMYFESFHLFDEKVGKIVDALKNTKLFEETMIIITADHGVSFNDKQSLGIRVGDKSRQGVDVFQMWNEVAHIPLIIKYPNQKSPLIISDRRSQSSIAKTITNNLNAKWVSEYDASEDLSDSYNESIVFADTTNGIEDNLRWELDAQFMKADPWNDSDLKNPMGLEGDQTSNSGEGLLDLKDYTITEYTFETLAIGQAKKGLIRIESKDKFCGGANGRAILVGDDGTHFKVMFERSGNNRWGNFGWVMITTSTAPSSLYCKK